MKGNNVAINPFIVQNVSVDDERISEDGRLIIYELINAEPILGRL